MTRRKRRKFPSTTTENGIILYYIIYYTEYADKDKDKEILNYNPLPSRGIIGVHFFKEKSNIIYQYISYTGG